MDPEQLRQRVISLEDENHQLQRKCNGFELQCDKLKNELELKAEIWIEKEAFFRMKLEDNEKTISSLQEQAKNVPTGHSDVELKGKLMAAEKRNSALKIEIQSLQNELQAKTKVDTAKNALVDMQDKRIEQLKRENKGLTDKADAEGEASKGSNADRNTAADQQAIKTLQMKLTVQEKAYNGIVRQNKELKLMMNTLEQKCQAISKLAREKVSSYASENKKLSAQVLSLEGALKELGSTTNEDLGSKFAELKIENSQLKSQLDQLNESVATNVKEVAHYKAQIIELGKMLEMAGFSKGEASPDDLLDALNESEYLSRQLQSGIEGLRKKLDYPPGPTSESSDNTRVDDATNENVDTTPAQDAACVATKNEESGGTIAPPSTPADSIDATSDIDPAVQAEVNEEVQQMIQDLQAEEQLIAQNLRKEIEEKKKELELLRIQKDESDRVKKEKSRLLLEAQESLLREMANKREEMSEIRKDIKGMRSSVIDQLAAANSANEQQTASGSGEQSDQANEQNKNENSSSDAKSGEQSESKE